jgi:hypothetical protein
MGEHFYTYPTVIELRRGLTRPSSPEAGADRRSVVPVTDRVGALRPLGALGVEVPGPALERAAR